MILLRRKRALLLQLIRRRRQGMRNRSVCQQEMNSERESRGEFARLVQRYREVDPEEHYGYLRMYKKQFDYIVDKIRSQIHTNFRCPRKNDWL